MISVLETSQAIKQWAIKLDLLTIGNNQEEAIEIRLFFGWSDSLNFFHYSTLKNGSILFMIVSIMFIAKQP